MDLSEVHPRESSRNLRAARLRLDRDGHPWITLALIAACVGIFLSIVAGPEPGSAESFARFGVLGAREVRAGGYYSLLSSALVHVNIWHIGFNMYWLWLLGAAMERAIGSPKYLLFVVLASFASGMLQMSLGGALGHGASGVVYAVFGFLWIARPYSAAFQQVVDDRVVRLLLIWLFLCIPLDYFGVFPVANGGHFGGILFGMGVAGLFVRRYRRPLVAAGLVLLLTLPTVTLFWCPWSLLWVADKAYAEHNAGHYDAALRHYSRVIEMDPDNGWAYANRSLVYETLGRSEDAERDRERAESLGEYR